MRPLEYAEVARAWSERGIDFKEGQILTGEYVQQGLRDTIFRFEAETPIGKKIQITVPMSSKRLIPLLDNIKLR